MLMLCKRGCQRHSVKTASRCVHIRSLNLALTTLCVVVYGPDKDDDSLAVTVNEAHARRTLVIESVHLNHISQGAEEY